jgi:hypothetical protein
MSWQQLLADRRVKEHKSSRAEIRELMAVVTRDLADARIKGLSSDRRFATAYNAALQAAKMCIACTGYRIAGPGHHATTFEALSLVFELDMDGLVIFFDACRRKRNQVDYDRAHIISDSESLEITERAAEFFGIAVEWIRLNHPEMLP